MGFPTKNDQHLGCFFGGTHHLRKQLLKTVAPGCIAGGWNPPLPLVTEDTSSNDSRHGEIQPNRWGGSTKPMMDDG